MIKEIDDKNLWDNFITEHGPKSGAFLQSFLWGEFQKSFGRKMWRLGNFNGKNLDSTALIIRHNLPFGKSYLYCPRGPIASQENFNEEIFEEILKIAKKEKSIFFRLEPLTNYESRIKNQELKKTRAVQPQQTSILNLAKSEEELLAKMHPKTRYNIKVASRYEVVVRKLSITEENFEIFWKLLDETSKRDKFSAHPKNYYKKMFDVFGNSEKEDARVALLVASYKNKPLAAELVMFFGETATYLHGASSEEDREVMAPYAMHWEIIQEAKKMGYKYYDLWGIDEKKWPGVTRFKRGFGGEEISYPGAFDLPVQKTWYKIYSWVREIM